MTTPESALEKSPFWVSKTSIFSGEPVYFNSDESVIYAWLEGDAEWNSQINQPIEPLTLQLSGLGLENSFIYEHPLCGLNLLPTWENENILTDLFQYNYRLKIPQNYQLPLLCLHYGMFYSPMDLLLLFATRKLQHFVAKQLQQKPGVAALSDLKSGRVYSGLIMQHPHTGKERSLCLIPHDLSTIFGKGYSLKKTCETLSIPLLYKTNLDDYKSNMKQAYIEKTQDFIDYAMGDLKAKEILLAYQKLIHQICQEIAIEPIAVSHTLGSNVYRILKGILTKQCEQTLVSQDLVSLFQNKPKELQVKNLYSLISQMNEEATANWLRKQQIYDSNKYLLSMVDGGYCKNLSPQTTRHDELLVDVDIHSCYGNGLLNQEYPIGRPCFISYRKSDEEKKLTLKEFIQQKLKKVLVNGLWYARISTSKPLTFQQDLFLSKIAPSQSNQTRENYEEMFTQESQDILGEFILLTTEIKNGALTHDLLQLAMSVMTNQEWSEFSNKVVVDGVIFYPKSLQLNTIEELVQAEVLAGGIETSINKNYGEVIEDKRTHHWVSIPMGKNWIDKLLGMRKNHPKTQPESKALNQVYKAIINATYGIIASPYYDLSNVVVANNITARARAMAWMMAKGLGMNQVITDGGVFPLNKVNMWQKKQPGMNSLTLIDCPELLTAQARRNLIKIPLGWQEWTVVDYEQLGEAEACQVQLKTGEQMITGSPNNYPEINQLVKAHLQQFFQGNIDILKKEGVAVIGYDTDQDCAITKPQQGQFSFEVQDIYLGGSYHSTSNYLLERINHTYKIKTRAYQWQKPYYLDEKGEEIYEGEHPIIECLTAIKEGRNIPPFPKGYTPIIITANAYHQPSQLIKEHKLLPGETTTISNWLRPISLSMFRWQTVAQYRAWTKRHSRLRREKGYGLELYFMNANGSVRYEEAVRKIQEAIDDGKKWIEAPNAPDPDTVHPFYHLV